MGERTASVSAASARDGSRNSSHKCQSSIGGKFKENIGPRGKGEETRYTEQRRPDYPIIAGNRQKPAIARRFDRYKSPDQSINLILANSRIPSFMHSFIPSFLCHVSPFSKDDTKRDGTPKGGRDEQRRCRHHTECLLLQGSAKRWAPGCVNAAGKGRQK